MIRTFLIGATSLTLATGPAMAVAAPPPVMIERSGAESGDSALAGGSWLPPILFAAIVLGGILMATGVLFDDDDAPASP